jgi:hypothetical protein
MATAEERMRILKMISDKQITAEEGARLLEALRTGADAPRDDAGRPKWLRVKVTDRRSEKIKLNVTVPIGLVDVAIKMGARFAPEMGGMDVGVIQDAIREGIQGRIVGLDDNEDGERVEIFVE